VELEPGSTVNHLLEWLERAGRMPKVFDAPDAASPSDGSVPQGLLVIVNHVNAAVLDGAGTRLADGDSVTVIAAVAGG
jgi:molybdopterin converting factor small subunit